MCMFMGGHVCVSVFVCMHECVPYVSGCLYSGCVHDEHVCVSVFVWMDACLNMFFMLWICTRVCMCEYVYYGHAWMCVCVCEYVCMYGYVLYVSVLSVSMFICTCT